MHFSLFPLAPRQRLIDAGIFDFANSYVQVDADFLEADEVSIAPTKTIVSALAIRVMSGKGSRADHASSKQHSQ